ncbi:secreted RxLR effector protein 161-like [Osmia bicornis bicornis]|uniref:secreted RxLR effector protein 161-like n=1 Tax=Osmia bicornis bicornis TaxID=1437191 RepID=UPI001EAE9C91|nr:secreted RxLR effector protein 161-like [Osmia bicornis bicornis]
MEKRPYRELVGGLNYLANASRPEYRFCRHQPLVDLTQTQEKAHWDLAKRVIRYLKATSNYTISYRRDNEKLIAYSDSDWGGDVDDRRSCTGNLLILAGGPVSWKSKKQKSVSLSTMEAEYAALAKELKR